jgi:multidrug efflux system membrane fusion protein
MITIQFLAEWAIRSSILILCGALLLQALRVKDPAIRLAAWTVMLCGSLAIPAIAWSLPKMPLAVIREAAQPRELPAAAYEAEPARAPAVSGSAARGFVRFDWEGALLSIYLVVAGALLLRLGIGLEMSRRLMRNTRVTGQITGGIEIRESDRVASPAALGIARPVIVVPADWREWDVGKLEAVLAHERSHIRRRDPAVQALSAIHRALLWHSPLSWWLHQRIVRMAEEASDDAAVAVTRDRASYAEVLLEFMQRGVRGARWQGVPMARYSRPDDRIQRILDGTALSGGVTRWSIAAILLLGAPLAYLVAAAAPGPVQANGETALPTDAVQPEPSARNSREDSAEAAPQTAASYITGLGTVTATTVTIRPRIDGQLMSVSFKEGDMVQAGQVLATVDPRLYQVQLEQAEAQLARDQAALKNARVDLDRSEKLVAQRAIPETQLATPMATVAQLEGVIHSDEANINGAKLQLTYAQIIAPISGIVGLRAVDLGNMVHAADATGIAIINQLQPIAVVFNIPEEQLPQVRARLKEGASLTVEAWNRTNTAKIATGQLTAIDNQIDLTTATVKLKAAFENKDSALFPNQFVNVRLLIGAR